MVSISHPGELLITSLSVVELLSGYRALWRKFYASLGPSCFSCKWAARWWWCRCSVMRVIRSENKNRLNWQGSRRLIMQTHLKGRWGCKWLLKGPKQNQGEESQKKPEFKFHRRNWAYSQSRGIYPFSRIVESTRRASPERAILYVEMATVTRTRVSLLVLAFMAITIGVQCRSLRSQLRKVTSFQGERKIRIGHVQRRSRREPGSGHDQCALLSAPWTESTTPLGDWGQMYRLTILSTMSDGPRRAVFPEQALFRFVRRVYRCCQVGYHCGSVKGIQGGKVGGK